MTGTESGAGRGYIPAEFETLVAPEQYTSKRDGQVKTAHNIALFIDGQGSGRLYVSEATHRQVAALGLKRGAPVEVEVGMRLFRGDLTAAVVGIRAL